SLAGAYNFGPQTNDAVPVRELVELARAAYGAGEVHYGDGSEGPQEQAWLTLDVAKVEQALGVTPRMTLVQAITQTMAWYRAHQDGAAARQLCLADISDFDSRAMSRPDTPKIRRHAV
ncbi:MAG: CDP-glucose 4,6-dehydratase, partial [Rhizobiales bacterium]|nr:CDP-glucose 4,6-dehydratase [Hyphomicrobiales bacterium]